LLEAKINGSPTVKKITLNRSGGGVSFANWAAAGGLWGCKNITAAQSHAAGDIRRIHLGL